MKTAVVLTICVERAISCQDEDEDDDDKRKKQGKKKRHDDG
jgi:hypothetical protein